MRRSSIISMLFGFGLLAGTSVQAMKPAEDASSRTKGKAVYGRVCVFCHGITGAGDGPAAFFIASYSGPGPRDLRAGVFKFRSTPGTPRPRDFRTGLFKFRTTVSGVPPTDQDLFRTVTRGIVGFMPSFRGLPEEQRWEVIYYIKSFSDVFKGPPPKPITIGSPIPGSPVSIELGRQLYHDLGCIQCHGPSGRGDGPQVANLRDYQNLPIKPRDLANPTAFKNGRRRQDIYRTILTGLDGTPMPSFQGAFPSGKDADAWHVVNYILSLSGLIEE